MINLAFMAKRSSTIANGNLNKDISINLMKDFFFNFGIMSANNGKRV